MCVCVYVHLNTFSFFPYQIAYSKCYSYIFFIITRILIVLMTNTKWQQMEKNMRKRNTYTYMNVYVQYAGKIHEKIDISMDIAYPDIHRYTQIYTQIHTATAAAAEPLQIAIGHGCLLLCTLKNKHAQTQIHTVHTAHSMPTDLPVYSMQVCLFVCIHWTHGTRHLTKPHYSICFVWWTEEKKWTNQITEKKQFNGTTFFAAIN